MGGKNWHIPVVYFCGKGLGVDLCVDKKPISTDYYSQNLTFLFGNSFRNINDPEMKEDAHSLHLWIVGFY